MATLESKTYPGIIGGMNTAFPGHEIEDDEAMYLQDVVLNQPGLVRQRGPVQAGSGLVSNFTEKGSALLGTMNPIGSYRVAAITGDNSNGYFRMLSSDLSSINATYTMPAANPASPPSNPYNIIDGKPCLNGGLAIGVSNQYSVAATNQQMIFWSGANNANYSAGTITLTRGSATVTGSGTTWTSNASSGMFLFATVSDSLCGNFSTTLIGTVRSVDSNTQLTLETVSPYTSAGGTSYLLQSVRGFQYKIAKGRITTSASSTTVTGSNTKFISMFMDEVVYTSTGTTSTSSATITGLASTSSLKKGMRVSGTGVAANSIINSVDSGTQITMNQNGSANGSATITFKHGWNFYRASDGSFLGRLSLVNNEISVTLAANAITGITEERYYAICGSGDWASSTLTNSHKVGFLSAFYAGRQWYANHAWKAEWMSIARYSETADPEAVDLADFDGDYISCTSTVGTDTPIKALVPAYNSLVIIKENETFAITGSSPSSFSLKKIQDDGTLSGMSAQPYGGGVVWAGRDGIYSYDGVTVNNVSAGKLGEYYKAAIRLLDPTKYRIWSMIARNHYFLFFESLSPTIPVIKGTLPSTPSSMTICVNMETGAYSMMTNLNIRGFIETPADSGKQVIYMVNDSTKANLCYAYDLFDSDGRDTILCDSGLSAGLYRYGYTSAGSSYTGFSAAANGVYFMPFTVYAPSRVLTARIYSQGDSGGSAGTSNTRAGIYSETTGPIPYQLKGTSGVVNINQTDLAAYREYTFTPFELAAGNYWLVVQNETASKIKFFQGTTSNGLLIDSDTYSDGLDATYSSAGNSYGNGPLLAYVTVQTAGPDAYLETKKYGMDDPMRKKLMKQMAMQYVASGGDMRLDTVPTLNVIGKTSLTHYAKSDTTWQALGTQFTTWDDLQAFYPTWNSIIASNYLTKRIKFTKRTQLMSIRIWQDSPAVTKFVLGPFQIAYKWMRVGRV